MHARHKKITVAAGLLLAAMLLGAVLVYPKAEHYLYRRRMDEQNALTMKEISSKDVITRSLAASIEKSAVRPVVPERAYLEVPSFCQAPFPTDESWSFHHASCEEAAALQAVYYFQKKEGVPDQVDKTLRDMVAWQVKHFGVHKDIHADTLKLLLMGYFGYRDDEIRILRHASILDIKQNVAQGFPVIVPTYGRLLHNPYYTPPGPKYHMVTVVGYTRDRIITNDVGTKRGKDYSYDIDLFKKAMDQEGADCVVIVPRKVP